MILCLPFLMFEGRAQEAIDLYLETFPGAELTEIMHHPENTRIHDPAKDAENTAEDSTAESEAVADWETTLVASAQLKIGGQTLMIQDSLIKRDFEFTPSMSIGVVVESAEEFSRITNRLVDGGTYLMEPGQYDFATNFAWVKDRFGLSWQVNHSTGQPRTESTEEPTWQSKGPDFG